MSYKDRFWQNAPQSLWDREAEEHRRDSFVRPNPEPFEVTRPLVLVVDDDPRTRLMATKVIEGLGYGAIVASNGEAGLVMARRYMPELILTEALMPRMDGREMCRRLKEDPPTSEIKVVVTTALYTQSKYRTEAYKLYHVDEYLSKPINFNDLRRVLQKHLG
jgi:CheY-like chemotaxis protein